MTSAGTSPPAPRTRIVIADDAALLREGIARLLDASGFEVVSRCQTLNELLSAVRTLRPDVAIVDIRMPPTHTDEGIRALRAIRAEHGAAVGVLILSQYLEPEFAVELVTDAVGGVGYLLKERVADIDDFADAVRRIARGGSVVDASIVSALLGRNRSTPLADLTEREREVLAEMAAGRSNQAIGDRLRIAAKTVEAHVNAIFSKLGLEPAADDNRRVLAVLAFLAARDASMTLPRGSKRGPGQPGPGA